MSLTHRFTRNICLPQSPVHFKVWVDLLYHGVPVAGPDLNPQPTTATPPGSGRRGKNRGGWTPLDDDRLRRALRKARNRTSAHDRKEGKSRRKFTWRMKKQRRRKNRLAGVARPDARQGETQDRDGGEEGEAEEALARVKRMMGAQPPRGTLVSSGARAGSSAWGGRAMRLERILLPALYARGSHRVSFLCDSIGPAGLYSVRLITNVSSSPVIASSEWFTVRALSRWEGFSCRREMIMSGNKSYDCNGHYHINNSNDHNINFSDKCNEDIIIKILMIVIIIITIITTN